MSDKFYFDKEFIKKTIENLFAKYWQLIIFLGSAAFFILIFIKWEYPFWDSLFIAISILLSLLVAGVMIRKSEYRNAEVGAMLLLGIISLQAAWPIFMPRISLEDINQVKGIIYADKGQPQMYQEAVIRVKPPLLPIIMNRDYPIANGLTEVYDDYGNPNLEIKDNSDGRNINIRLNRITGWSFDEIRSKIFYRANKPFILPNIIYLKDTNISSVYKIPKPADYEFYPYDHGFSFWIENENNFPIGVYNISFSIYNNTEAWIDIKKWIEDGYCAYPVYGWSNGSSTWAKVNGNYTLISARMFKSQKISLEIFYIPLAPHETKNPHIIFKEAACGDTIKDNPSYTSYNISGTVTSYKVAPYRDDGNYFIILIKNMNTSKLGSKYVIPNTQYIYMT